MILAGTSTVAFIYLIDYAARLLRPVSIVWRLGEEGLAVIEEVYPSKIKGRHIPSKPSPPLGAPDRIVVHHGMSAIILAVDLETLRLEAERTNGIIEFTRQVGDFLAVGEPLFLLYGGAVEADDRVLHGAVAIGPERTIEQDATFAFRVIVDIAIKALSKAINDPSTAVVALDQLHRLLRVVGRRHLHDDVIMDSSGKPRVIFRTPGWDDFVQLSCREIRLYGAENYQVARRLRAMLENLVQSLFEARHAALLKELELLDRALERLDLLPDDLALARTSDLQGLGAPIRDPRLKGSAPIAPPSAAASTPRTSASRNGTVEQHSSTTDHWPIGNFRSTPRSAWPRSDSDALYDRHGFDHGDAQWPHAVGRKIHYVSGHRGRRLRQEHAQPAVLERLEQVANLPTALDADQCRLYAACIFELGEAFGHALHHLVLRQTAEQRVLEPARDGLAQVCASGNAGAERNDDQHQCRENCDSPNAGRVAPLQLQSIGNRLSHH